MKRGARGTQRFNSLMQSARMFGQIVLLVAIMLTPLSGAFAQEADPLPRVRNTALHDGAVRINALLFDINDRHVKSATRILDIAQGLLERIVEASERHARRGSDVSVVRTAIADARQKIDDARDAVRNQSEHEYILDTATDATVRERLRAVRDQIGEDLRIVRTAVREAVSAVRDAVRALQAAQATDPSHGA